MGNFRDVILRDVTSLGSVTFFMLLVLFLFSFNEFNFGKSVLFGLVLALTISSTIRLIYFKDRPQKRKFNNFLTRIYASSFPSLHTTLIFFLAFTLFSYFDDIIFRIFILFLAFLVSYSRIYLKKHDWKDVFGGIVLSVIVFLIVNMLI
jgi:membrane-associated phospholipid phosphatase